MCEAYIISPCHSSAHPHRHYSQQNAGHSQLVHAEGKVVGGRHAEQDKFRRVDAATCRLHALLGRRQVPLISSLVRRLDQLMFIGCPRSAHSHTMAFQVSIKAIPTSILLELFHRSWAEPLHSPLQVDYRRGVEDEGDYAHGQMQPPVVVRSVWRELDHIG